MIIDGALIKTLDLDFLKEYSDYLKEASVVDKPLPKCPPKCSAGLDTPPIAKTPEPRFSDCGSPDILDMFMYPQFDSESETDDITNRQLEEVADFIQRSLLQESVSSKHQHLKHVAVDGVQTYQLLQQSSTASNHNYVQNHYLSSMPTSHQVGSQSSASMYQQRPHESASLVPVYQVQQHASADMMSTYSSHSIPTSATTSSQQQIPSQSYQHQQIIPSLSPQQNILSLSYQQGIPSSSSTHRNMPPLSYQQSIPSTSSQQNIPSPTHPQQNTAAPSLQLLRQQLTAAATRIPPVSVPVKASPNFSLLASGINHQPSQGSTTIKGKGRRSSQNTIEAPTVFEVPQSPANKRGRKRSVTAETGNGGPGQQPQTKQRTPRARTSMNTQQLPVIDSAQPSGQAGNHNAMLLSHQHLFPALAQLLCQPKGVPNASSQHQYGQPSNRSAENVNGGGSHLRQTVVSVGNSQQNKLPGTSGQIFYYQINPTSQTNTSQPVTFQNIGQFRNQGEPVVISLDNQRNVIQGYNPGMPGYISTALLSNYQNGLLQISPQSANTLNPAQFVRQQDNSSLPQQQFVLQQDSSNLPQHSVLQQNNSNLPQQQFILQQDSKNLPQQQFILQQDNSNLPQPQFVLQQNNRNLPQQQFVLQQDNSNLPQQPFVVNLMTPPDSNLTPSPASSSTPSPEVLSSGQDYGLLKYRLM